MILRTFGALAAALLCAASLSAQAPTYDLILRNGRIVDGTGNGWYRADLAVSGDRIVRIAVRIAETGRREIDVAGQIVAPGFIDAHSHGGDVVLDVPAAENQIRQGVTTIIAGPDGSSPLPLAPWFDSLASTPRTINVGTLVGQGTIRTRVVGQDDRAATPAELDSMRALVERAMRDGALGLSTGLFYVPGTFTPTEEVIELAKVAGRFGGVHSSHMRNETSDVVKSVLETIRIGEEGGLPTQVTHHKIIGPGFWGQSVRTLALVDSARARGVDVTIDQYPYTASSTSIQAALLPAWVLEGGREQTLARLRDGATRERIRAESARIIEFERGGGNPKNVVIARCSWDPSLAGKTLADVAVLRGMEPTLPNAAVTAMWITEQGGCQGIFHAIGEEDLRRIMQHPATMIASDGGNVRFGQDQPHPRNYGSFARVLGHYVRDEGVLTLEDAVRKMSALPAQRFGLTDRGVLRPGMKADIAVFDPALVRDLATFERPHQYAEGFSVVVVNGEVVLDGGGVTAARPGAVLRGPGAPRP